MTRVSLYGQRGKGPPLATNLRGIRPLRLPGCRSGTATKMGGHGLVAPLEVVKGPATLLYSGNAMGGTVNAVSRHHQLHQHPHEGRRGFVSASAGTANALGGANAGFEYGAGPWMFWGQRGGVRTGDDRAPGQGVIYNSRSRMINVDAGGVGRYGEEFFFSVETKYDDGSYGQLRSRESEGLPHLCPAALFASVRGERLQPGRPALSKSLLFSSRIWPPRSAAAYGSRTWSGSFDQIPFPVAPRPSAHLGWPNRCFDRRDSRRSLRW